MNWRRGPPIARVAAAADAYAVHQRTCATCSKHFHLCREGLRLMEEFLAALNSNTTSKGEP